MRTLFAQKLFIRKLPANLQKNDLVHFQKIQQYTCPELKIYRFESVNILPDSTLFKWIFPLGLSFPFYRQRLRHHNAKGILAIRLAWKRKEISAGDPIIIHDVWTKNYYHWVTQALPRLLLAQELSVPFTLLLPEDHQSDFHVESLRMLNVDFWLTLESQKVYYHVHHLLYPTHDIQIGDYHDDLIRLLHRKLAVMPSQHEAPVRLFVHRTTQTKRRILNEEEVLNTFLAFGFQIVEFESLSFSQQILLSGKADVLAGVHGAGLTNMLFMPAGSTVFELTTQVNGEQYYYYSLSNALSHRYFYQLCDADQIASLQVANLKVDVALLKENIRRVLTP
jgi:capsular polysaccharide biosynthesis protein